MEEHRCKNCHKLLFKGKFIDLIEEEYLLPNNVIMTRENYIRLEKEVE